MASEAASILSAVERRAAVVTRQTGWLLGAALALALILPWTVSTRSLTTDEAFSAYLACQNGWSSFWTSLRTGDSSDLQMIGYYLYLHLWTLLFGASEYSLRSSNLPFIAGFLATVGAASWRVSRSLWPCLIACSLPFLWEQANNARPYVAVLAFTSVAVTAACAWVSDDSVAKRDSLPWIVLGSLWLACAFHMLAGLCLLPLAVLIFLFSKVKFSAVVNAWMSACATMALPFLGLGAFFCWTFVRGTDYRYVSPSFWSIASLLYRFMGLGTFGPNRRYDVPFTGYLTLMAVSALLLASALTALTASAWRTRVRRFVVGFVLALVVALTEVVGIVLITGRQLDVRHLAAVLPFFIGLLLVLSSPPVFSRRPSVAALAVLTSIAVWSAADYRLLFVPEHQTEDFRSAVRQAIALQRTEGANILLVADPVAAAYYGLTAQGEKPCFPLSGDCGTMLARVSWHHAGRARYALSWTAPNIQSVMQVQKSNHIPVVVLFSEQRDPLYTGSEWRSVLHRDQDHISSCPHGFSLYLFQ
jgi:hypothetical protein